MNQLNSWNPDDLPTLDPPGTIVVVGAGPLGIEAALYGRFLGYDVTLVEAVEVGHGLRDQIDSTLQILPNRCLSPLATAALEAQDHESVGRTLPLTAAQWIRNALIPLIESDLLHGRLVIPKRVTNIVTVPVAIDADGDADADGEEFEGEGNDEELPIPPDFRLTLLSPDGQSESLEAESVMLAVGKDCEIELGFSLPAPYFFRLGGEPSDDWEQGLLVGHREIVHAYAQLVGRADLDLYRPQRL